MSEPRVKTAVTFPGQGSQRPGMARTALERCPEARELLDGLSGTAGVDLARLVADPGLPADELTDPRTVHLALVAAGLACWLAYRRAAAGDEGDDAEDGPNAPVYLAGHSLGEITALACAGALPPDRALALAARRGELLAAVAADHPGVRGGMTAVIGPDAAEVERRCAEVSAAAAGTDFVCAVNFNTPTQTVIAGTQDALAAAEAACARIGARTVRLPVADAFHTRLVGSAAAPLYEFARTLEWREPEIPVIAGRTGRPHAAPASPDGMAAALALQLASPVRWTEVLAFLARAGVRRIVAAAPAAALNRMNAACVPTLETRTWNAPNRPGDPS